MPNEEWEREYLLIVEQHRLQGAIEEGREGAERRRDTRMLPDAAHIVVGDDPWAALINVSRAGLAFYAEQPHAGGDELPISLEGGISARAVVLDCRPETGDPAAMAGQFRVSCSFIDRDEGLRFFLALRTLVAAQLDPQMD